MFKRIRPTAARLAAACALLLCSTLTAFAQSQATTGNIEGRVVDPQGAVVPGASVVARNKETGLERTATTDGEGNYRVVLLPPGLYTVRASAPNFGDRLGETTVTVGGKSPLDLELVAGGVSGELTVTAEAPVVETSRTSVSTVVNEKAIENLPVNGRNYLDFATLTPGVVRDPTRQGDLSVGGQKGTLNNLQVDGADNNNTFFGQAFGRTGVRPPYQFSEESVKEFQVNQNGFSAEFGRAGGAVINVVTRSGTNDWHGGLFEYFRDESLNANLPSVKISPLPGTTTPRPNKRPPSQVNQFGGRLGGPIARNRAFFFFTYDGQRTNFTDVAQFPAFPASLQSFFQSRLDPYKVDRNQDVYMAKVDWAVDDANQLSVRFNRQNFTGVNNEFTSSATSQSAEEHSGNSIAKTTTVGVSLTSTFSQSLVNEFRAQVARDEEPGTANSDAPELQIRAGALGTLFFGRNNFSPRETTINRAQAVNNLSWLHGGHVTKFGVDFVTDSTLNFFPGSFGGIYVFNSLADFAANLPAQFTQRFAGAGLGATTTPNTSDYAFYVQDDWRVTRRLTLNLGVRYDYQKMAEPPIQNDDPVLLAANLDTRRSPRDRDNFAPRVGFSFAPDSRSVVRGGYGLFYGRTTGIMLGTAHSGNGIQTTGITLNGAAAIAAAGLTYPNVLAGLPPGVNTGRPDLFIFSDDYQQPYVIQARAAYERELFANTAVSATYMFFRGVHLSRTRDINLLAPVPVTVTSPDGSQSYTLLRHPGAPTGTQTQLTATAPARPFTNYNRISLFEDTGNSRYHALALQLNRRFANNFQFLASYTYSVAKDDRPDQTAVVPGGGDDAKIVFNQFDIREDFSYADADLRHRFVFSPVYSLDAYKGESTFLRAVASDWTFSGIVQLQSGFAFSQGLGNFDLNRDGNARNDRVPGTCRNCFRTPPTYQVDARVTRRIPFSERAGLRLILEGFNLFNRSNVLAVNTGLFNNFDPVPASGTLRFRAPAANAPYNEPRAFLNARELQLAIKFDF
jgi:hypothetical protein